MGFVPASAYNTRSYLTTVTFASTVPEYLRDLCYDPQTSGGLLISAPEDIALQLLAALRQAGIEEAAIIGRVSTKKGGEIYVY